MVGNGIEQYNPTYLILSNTVLFTWYMEWTVTWNYPEEILQMGRKDDNITVTVLRRSCANKTASSNRNRSAIIIANGFLWLFTLADHLTTQSFTLGGKTSRIVPGSRLLHFNLSVSNGLRTFSFILWTGLWGKSFQPKDEYETDGTGYIGVLHNSDSRSVTFTPGSTILIRWRWWEWRTALSLVHLEAKGI